MRQILFCCLISFSVSCSNEAKNSILPPEKMEAVLLDFIMAEVYTNTHVNVDSVLLAQKENVKLQKKVFALHGITKEEFKESFEHYTKHPVEFTRILDSISARENRKNIVPIN